MPSRQDPITTERARQLRARQTKAEELLWQVLRGRRLCGLKFRRQLPIETAIADFACIEHRLVVELDGEYHDHTLQHDQARQQRLEAAGWRVLRFRNDDVLDDVESVAVTIARSLDVEDQLYF